MTILFLPISQLPRKPLHSDLLTGGPRMEKGRGGSGSTLHLPLTKCKDHTELYWKIPVTIVLYGGQGNPPDIKKSLPIEYQVHTHVRRVSQKRKPKRN